MEKRQIFVSDGPKQLMASRTIQRSRDGRKFFIESIGCTYILVGTF